MANKKKKVVYGDASREAAIQFARVWAEPNANKKKKKTIKN